MKPSLSNFNPLHPEVTARLIHQQFEHDTVDISGLINKSVDTDLEKAEFSGKDRKKLAKEGEAESGGSYPIRNKSDLHNAIKAYGRSKDKVATKKWIKKRAKELDCEDCLPDDWSDSVEKAFENLLGVSTSSDPIEKAFEDILEKGGEGSKGGKVIGHTKSGKPIYSSFNHPGHKEFSEQDHKDAAKIHSADIEYHKGRIKDNDENTDISYHEMHRDRAMQQKARHDAAGEDESGETENNQTPYPRKKK